MFAHRGNDLALAIDAFAGVREELNEAGRLHDRIDADGKLGKEAVGQIVDDYADDFRRALAWRRLAAPRL
jgi:hypothetical protein